MSLDEGRLSSAAVADEHELKGGHILCGHSVCNIHTYLASDPKSPYAVGLFHNGAGVDAGSRFT